MIMPRMLKPARMPMAPSKEKNPPVSTGFSHSDSSDKRSKEDKSDDGRESVDVPQVDSIR